MGATKQEPRKRDRVCRNCRHFFITHDPRAPYGCKAMGFKSPRLPALTVEAASGMPCESFTPKVR